MTRQPQEPTYTLSESESKSIFADLWRQVVRGRSPVPRPFLRFVFGPPAAGKTRAMKGQCDNAVELDVDDFRPYVPSYEWLALADDLTAAELTQPDVHRWLEWLLARAVDDRYNVVLFGTGNNAGRVRAFIELARRNGYEVHVSILMCPQPRSAVNNLCRYADERATVGYGRYVPPAVRETVWLGLQETADLIDADRLADTVAVVRIIAGTGGWRCKRVYSNAVRDGAWTERPATGQRIKEERHRALEPDEAAALRADLARLRADPSLPPTCREDLAAVIPGG